MADLKYMPMNNSPIEPGWYVVAPKGAQMVRYTGDATTQGVTQYDLIPGIMAWAAQRDEVIRQLVEALEKCPPTSNPNVSKEWMEERLAAWWRLEARHALAAARKLVRQPYMGQIMAECDCPRRDECQRAGRCIAEVR